VFDQLLGQNGGDGISPVQLLADANEQGIPLSSVTDENVSAVLPLLQLATAVKADISAAVVREHVPFYVYGVSAVS